MRGGNRGRGRGSRLDGVGGRGSPMCVWGQCRGSLVAGLVVGLVVSI